MNLFDRLQRKVVRHSFPLIFRPKKNHESLTRLGSRFGGWTIPLSRLRPESICYSFGVGEDVTFDLALVTAVGCRVHLFDPTPRSKLHFNNLQQAAQNIDAVHELLTSAYDQYSLQAISKLTYHDFGVWSEDTELDFYKPALSAHVSHSATNLQHTNVGFRAAVKSIRSIASMLGHTKVDLIKMDIEGAETTVINSIISDGPLPDCLCVEFDAAAQGGKEELKVLWDLIGRLKAHYRLSHIEHCNFLFVRDE